MWIKKLYANFGKLDNKTLEFSPGLNIISGKNESGKSTWSAFIRAMFFGISTREKAKAGHLPDKEKYLPWNGSAMYGKMELIRGDDEITIERTPSRKGAVLVSETATTAKGEPAPTGEELLGVARGVYERTAFISQSGLSIDGDKDTEKRILSIASSGDESVSAVEVISRLEKEQRTLRAPRGGGILPDLESERAALEASISASLLTEKEIAETQESLEITAKRLDETNLSIAIAKAEEKKKTRNYTEDAKRDLLDKEAAAKEVEALPTREVYDTLLSKKNEWQTLLLSAERENAKLREAESELSALKDDLKAFPAFGGMSPDLAEREAEKDIEKLDQLPSSKGGISILLIILAIVAAVLGVISAPLFFIIAFLCLAGGVFLLITSRKKCSSIISELQLKYGEAESSHIRKLLAEYLAKYSKLGNAEKAVETARANALSRKNNAALREKDVAEILLPFGFTPDMADEAQEKIKWDMLRRERAAADLRAAKIRFEAVLQTTDAEDLSISYEESEIPEESLEELLEIEEALSLRKKNLELNLAALRERISGFDRKMAEERLVELSENIEKHTFRYDAITLAINTLSSADRELKSRFSPEVEKRASEIFAALTGGSFEVVRVLDSDFDMSVAANAASVPRDKLFLSKGTYDELYLALRLALCDTILPNEETLPMVLDDVLVNFDDERAFRTLSYLKKLAETRQIILFTCHTREARFFAEDEKVNKLSI